jgi:hypothetical protein
MKLDGSFQYNEKEEYFMLSYFDLMKVCYARKPFLTMNELLVVLREMSVNITRFEDIKIFNERSLDEVMIFEDDTGVTYKCSLREDIYGGTYHGFAGAVREHRMNGVIAKYSK